MDKIQKQKHGNIRPHEGDTGSPEVQLHVSNRITELTEHLREHKHDESSRRGLLKMWATRVCWLTSGETTTSATWHDRPVEHRVNSTTHLE